MSKKEVYVENGVKISFHTFPEEKKLFLKWIVAIRRDIGKHFQVTKHTSLLETFQAIAFNIFLHLRGVKGLENQQQYLQYFTGRKDPQ